MKSTRRSFLHSSALAAAAGPLLQAANSAAQARVRHFDPAFGTAVEALAALHRRAISSRELVTEVFGRIKSFNPDINAFITLVEDDALAQATEADALRARRVQVPPLLGLPIFIKDLFATRGVRTTNGLLENQDNVPKRDAVVVARLKQAGA
ncbi:MAG TPA: amidase family protein, partial [Polyangiales bacterium]|nr:amidase family protein [Polyangiales bacterium]